MGMPPWYSSTRKNTCSFFSGVFNAPEMYIPPWYWFSNRNRYESCGEFHPCFTQFWGPVRARWGFLRGLKALSLEPPDPFPMVLWASPGGQGMAVLGVVDGPLGLLAPGPSSPGVVAGGLVAAGLLSPVGDPHGAVLGASGSEAVLVVLAVPEAGSPDALGAGRAPGRMVPVRCFTPTGPVPPAR